MGYRGGHALADEDTGHERADQRIGDAGEVGDALGDGVPGDTEAAGQLVAELGLVEVAGGLGVPIQPGCVQRSPAAVVGLDGVGDQHVRVQQRIAVA